MSGIKRYSWSTDFMECWDDGDYVLNSDHESEIARAYDDAHCKVEAIYSAEIARLRAEADSLRKDAMRYRWLRDEAPEEWSVCRRIEWPKEKSGAELRIDDCNMDSEIDAAIGASA